MVAILLIIRYFIPFTSTSRLTNILLIIIYVIIGASIYLGIMIKTKLINQIFGEENINKIMKKIRKVRWLYEILCINWRRIS